MAQTEYLRTPVLHSLSRRLQRRMADLSLHRQTQSCRSKRIAAPLGLCSHIGAHTIF